MQLNYKTAIALFLLPLIWTPLTWGQAGVSSMSVGMSRAGISSSAPYGRFTMPSADSIRVEEFVNYHRHNLPLPKRGRVRLEARRLVDGNHEVFQIGITTPQAMGDAVAPPLNLVLVIDRSGSMSGARIQHVKRSMVKLAKGLRECDQLSICTFSDRAETHADGLNGSQLGLIEQSIDGIHADGWTNVHAGLMLGYQLAEKHFDEAKTNRVILLTDGRTNRGETNPESITRDSKRYNKEGIDLSTIGLGEDLNHDLLRDLAEAGRGLIHFVGDSVDIEKTFVKELESLLAPAARKVRLEIAFDCESEIKIFGYQPAEKSAKLVFKLDDLNHGATQVVLGRTKAGELANLTATLTYVDAISGEKCESVRSLSEEQTPRVAKNYAIAVLANLLKKAAKSSNEDKCEKAEKLLTKGIKEAKRIAEEHSGEVPLYDEDVQRIVKIVTNYRKQIRDCIARGVND